MEATPFDPADEATQRDLSLRDSQRLSLLLNRQQQGALTAPDASELAKLMTTYARRLHDRRMQQWAAQRGISVEQAHQEAEAHLTDALAWWETLQADPQQQHDLLTQASHRRAASC